MHEFGVILPVSLWCNLSHYGIHSSLRRQWRKSLAACHQHCSISSCNMQRVLFIKSGHCTYVRCLRVYSTLRVSITAYMGISVFHPVFCGCPYMSEADFGEHVVLLCRPRHILTTSHRPHIATCRSVLLYPVCLARNADLPVTLKYFQLYVS